MLVNMGGKGEVTGEDIKHQQSSPFYSHCKHRVFFSVVRLSVYFYNYFIHHLLHKSVSIERGFGGETKETKSVCVRETYGHEP